MYCGLGDFRRWQTSAQSSPRLIINDELMAFEPEHFSMRIGKDLLS